MTISWKGMFNYIFPPFRLLHKILHKIREDGYKTILIAPASPRQSWFLHLLLLSSAKPLRLPLRGDLLSQFKGKKLHQGLEKLHLHAWLLSGRLSDREAFLKKQPSASLEQLDSQQGQYMTQNGQSFVLGVCQNKDKGYTPSTIKGYRSAIARTIHLSGGPDFGSDEFYHSCLKTFVLNVRNRDIWYPHGTWELF
jgi:hypothetical protein